MALFTVQNLSGVRFGMPAPVSQILNAGESIEVQAASLDTPEIADLINSGLLGVVPKAGGSVGADAVEAASKSNAGLPQTLIGGPGAGVTVANAEVLTFTHNLGTTPVLVLVMDDADGGLAPSTVTVGGTANTVTVTNGSGGSLDLNVLLMFAPGTAPLGAQILATDSRIAVA